MFSETDLQRLLAANDQVSVVGHDAPMTKRTRQDDPWTATEKAFARQVLQPALEVGEYLWYMAQVTVYLVGQTYTFDFVALRPDGGADHFEVKGSDKLMSEERASVKVRWTASVIRPSDNSLHRVFWCRPDKAGGWVIREVRPKRSSHPIAR